MSTAMIFLAIITQTAISFPSFLLSSQDTNLMFKSHKVHTVLLEVQHRSKLQPLKACLNWHTFKFHSRHVKSKPRNILSQRPSFLTGQSLSVTSLCVAQIVQVNSMLPTQRMNSFRFRRSTTLRLSHAAEPSWLQWPAQAMPHKRQTVLTPDRQASGDANEPWATTTSSFSSKPCLTAVIALI